MSSTTLALLTTATVLMTGVPGTPAPAALTPPARVAKTDALLLRSSSPKTEIEINTTAGLDPLQVLRDEATQFAQLTEGWDGEHSQAPTAQSVDAALQFIDLLPGGLPLPGIMVSPEGEIGFYWDLNGGYADFSFSPAGEGSFFSRSTTGQEEFIDEIPINSLDRSWFFRRLGAMAAPQRRAA